LRVACILRRGLPPKGCTVSKDMVRWYTGTVFQFFIFLFLVLSPRACPEYPLQGQVRRTASPAGTESSWSFVIGGQLPRHHRPSVPSMHTFQESSPLRPCVHPGTCDARTRRPTHRRNAHRSHNDRHSISIRINIICS
jgi:hypothetical protein